LAERQARKTGDSSQLVLESAEVGNKSVWSRTTDRGCWGDTPGSPPLYPEPAQDLGCLLRADAELWCLVERSDVQTILGLVHVGLFDNVGWQ